MSVKRPPGNVKPIRIPQDEAMATLASWGVLDLAAGAAGDKALKPFERLVEMMAIAYWKGRNDGVGIGLSRARDEIRGLLRDHEEQSKVTPCAP